MSSPVSTAYGIKFECCGLWGWHGNPLTDRSTHHARQAAHRLFDPIWKSGRLTRSEAYARLAAKLGLHPSQCHMLKMNSETARKVPAAAREILQELIAKK